MCALDVCVGQEAAYRADSMLLNGLASACSCEAFKTQFVFSISLHSSIQIYSPHIININSMYFFTSFAACSRQVNVQSKRNTDFDVAMWVLNIFQ